MTEHVLSAAENSGRSTSLVRMLSAVTIGNCLELYDFTLFSFYAVLLAKVFFPTNSSDTALLLTFCTFGAGFIARPIGGLLLGTFADLRGRKAAVTLTMFLMTIGTGIIAVCPSYDSIGFAAPLLLAAGRMIQGFGIGGEIGATTTLLYEASPPDRRMLFISLQMASQGAAALLGALSGFAISALLPAEVVAAGGWRIPFLIGLLVGPTGLYLRASLHDAAPPAPLRAAPLKKLLTEFRGPIVRGMLLMLYGTANLYVVVFYMPTYLIKVVGFAANLAFLPGCIAGATILIGAPIFGALADRTGTRKLFVLVAAMLSATLILPALYLIASGIGLGGVVALVGLLCACNAVGAACVLSLICDSFPKQVRATGFSIVYSAGVIFGGIGQAIVTWLIQITGTPVAPAYYVITCSLLTVGSLVVGGIQEGAA